MKTAKTVMGIVSIVLFIIILFQSCATGVGNVIEGNETDTSSSGGVFLAFLVLIGGIVGIATKNSRGGGIAAGVFYIIAALIGFTNQGSFGDLIVWSVLSLIFGVLFLFDGYKGKSNQRRR